MLFSSSYQTCDIEEMFALVHITKGNASLTHAPGPGVETDKHNTTMPRQAFLEVINMRILCVVQWIENIFHFGILIFEVE